MRIVRLATREGGQVVDVRVPPFIKMPDVIMWGIRGFTFHAAISRDGDLACMEYREVFMYAAVEEVPKP